MNWGDGRVCRNDTFVVHVHSSRSCRFGFKQEEDRNGYASVMKIAVALMLVLFVSGVLPQRPGLADADVSLGSLTCSPGEEVKAEEAAIGPAFLVHCSFRSHGGSEEVYLGRMFRQNGSAAARNPRALVWAVRGPSGSENAAGFLGQTYTIRSTRAEGAIAPLVPKDGDENSVALYDLRAIPSQKPTKGIVTTLELKLVESPA